MPTLPFAKPLEGFTFSKSMQGAPTTKYAFSSSYKSASLSDIGDVSGLGRPRGRPALRREEAPVVAPSPSESLSELFPLTGGMAPDSICWTFLSSGRRHATTTCPVRLA